MTDVVVVGGGIGGLGNALALARAGRRVRVLEQASRFGEVGAGLQMAPNATRILRSWGLLDEVLARGVRPRRLPSGHDLAGVHVLRGLWVGLANRALNNTIACTLSLDNGIERSFHCRLISAGPELGGTDDCTSAQNA